MGVATAMFAACSEDYTNWTAPQSNPQTPEKNDFIYSNTFACCRL